MNTIKSVYYGWATLIAAGGGAYYFAKKSINADRAAKAEAEQRKRIAQYQLEAQLLHASNNSGSPPKPSSLPPTNRSKASVSDELKKRGDQDWRQQTDDAGQPSQEASMDPAPTRHAPEDEAQKTQEKSKYEASDVYRQRKGDRFS
ncbi:hypothetical protein K504DRAFT_463464 [Pleomassaria siparia CBS 279.74]|uniref:Uncharacterized protein n=1 Tax=Pleomassaria siparia CBS 279.74 TaxID=1314801 RepID=A0A6G1JRZ9_9PLEO|nr:hypothetical protein K504DRAFT_463464 [Pleomassaria siparia CBS 279.74]